MSYDFKKYIPTREPNKFIKFTISFNKDTYHWATGQTKQKGYQLVATPVERDDMWESFTAFQGFYKIIFPVERRSKKRLEEAIRIFNQEEESYIEHFKAQGIEF